MVCEDIGADMAGVCRLDGQAVLGPGLWPGETAEVRLTKVLSTYAFGRVERLVTPNPAIRRENDCPAYPRCGGCLHGREPAVHDLIRTPGGRG